MTVGKKEREGALSGYKRENNNIDEEYRDEGKFFSPPY